MAYQKIIVLFFIYGINFVLVLFVYKLPYSAQKYGHFFMIILISTFIAFIIYSVLWITYHSILWITVHFSGYLH